MPPHSFQYSNGILSWTGDAAALDYEIIFKLLVEDEWCIAYMNGTNTTCPFNHGSGTYVVRGKLKDPNNGWTNWGAVETLGI
jgi:hypothetical protein